MEGCSAGAMAGLPDDLLVEILSRVPAKSICRFKCVSKAWRDLIAHRDHRKRLHQPMQGLFVQTSEDPEVDISKSPRISFSFIDLSHLTERSVPLDIDPCFSFLTEMDGAIFLFDSCNGLILFGRRQEPSCLFDGYIVCNPTTRQWSVVPACGASHSVFYHTYLAFDPAVSSHFHLVQFQMSDVAVVIESCHVYSSETGTWSRVQIYEQKEQGQVEGWHHLFTLGHQCTFANGFLHLKVRGSDARHILVVDVQWKTRRMITVPGMTDRRHGHAFVCYLGQAQGHLHCMTIESAGGKNQKLSTWVLQDYDTQEWVVKNTVYTLDVFGETKLMPWFQVVAIHQDCNVVFFFNQWSYELIAYNMDHNEVSVIATFKDHKFQSQFACYIPYFSELPALTNKY